MGAHSKLTNPCAAVKAIASRLPRLSNTRRPGLPLMQPPFVARPYSSSSVISPTPPSTVILIVAGVFP